MFYAVRRGRQPGVYYSWDECREQVNRYPFASYKKFPNYEQAQHFIGGCDYSSKASCGPEISATVYTDGCCSHNGRYGAQAGIGVYWGPNNPLQPVEQAVDCNITRLNVCTDTEYTIKGMTEWVPKWKKRGWITLYGEEVVNKEEFENLDNLCKELYVQWTHVPGHHGIPGNEKADRLARKGARK